MKAAERFTKGQRVQYSTKGLAQLQVRQSPGTVTGFGRQDHLVRVKHDGITEVQTYHQDFIEPLSKP